VRSGAYQVREFRGNPSPPLDDRPPSGKLIIKLCEALEAKGQGAKRLDLLFTCRQPHEAIRSHRAPGPGCQRHKRDCSVIKIETIDPFLIYHEMAATLHPLL